MSSTELELSLRLDNKYQYICGVDEVGRGAAAGPVVSAAVIMSDLTLPGIKDSKQLSPKQRQLANDKIIASAHTVGIGISHPQEIDSINILQATFKSMRSAILSMRICPDFILVDGNQLIPDLPNIAQKAIIKGDSMVYSISAASIIAKVFRDNYMVQLHSLYPHFNWDKNKGYGTSDHISAINKYGISEHHRKSFDPIRSMLKDPWS